MKSPNIPESLMCPVCGGCDFKGRDNYGICPVCGWENDINQVEIPDETGANKYTLIEAREARSKLSAIAGDLRDNEIFALPYPEFKEYIYNAALCAAGISVKDGRRKKRLDELDKYIKRRYERREDLTGLIWWMTAEFLKLTVRP